MLKYLLSMFFWVTMATGLVAQDAMFSQFYTAAQNLNPALSGAFDGKYRASVLYRSQWGDVMGRNGYKDIYAGLDIRFGLKRSKDAIGAGLCFIDNKAGIGNFGNTGVMLSGAFHKVLGHHENSILSVGFNGGIIQRSLNFDGLSFEDQFDRINAYSLATNESIIRNNFAYYDLGLGLVWAVRPDGKQNSYYVGASGFHINNPDISFTASSSTLLPRIIVFGGADLRADKRSRLRTQPRVAAVYQASSYQLNAGMNFRYSLDEYDTNAFHVGGWLRGAKDNRSGMRLADLVATAGFEINGVMIGVSYDVTLSDIGVESRFRNGFEVSCTFIGSYENDMVACPTF